MNIVNQLVSRAVRRFMQPGKQMRAQQFAMLPLEPGKIVLLGDSITEQGIWNEWLPQLPVINRGIGGNTVTELHERLGSAVFEPSVVSLLIGTNDLSGLGDTTEPAKIAVMADALIQEIRARAPKAQLIVNSVMPRARRFSDDVRRLNESYQSLARKHGAQYLDLWPALDDGTGQLRPEYSADKLHLNGEGYAAWVDVLRPALEEAFSAAAVHDGVSTGDVTTHGRK